MEVHDAAQGKEGMPEAWGPERWRDAVAISPRAEALPAMLAAAEECAERLCWRFTVHGGALL
eukprot:7266168-Lingulodinium_polyedra.AAC.1